MVGSILKKLSTFIVACTLFFGVSTSVNALDWTVGIMFNTNYGAFSTISVADPQVRDGGYSDMHVMVRNYACGCVALSGWIKYAGSTPGFYVQWTEASGVSHFIFPSQRPNIGQQYQAEVVQYSGTVWDLAIVGINFFWFQDLGWDQADDFLSGGEVSSSANAMGVSGNLYVQFNNAATGGSLTLANYWAAYNTNPAVYTVIGVLNPNSWQVYGNN